jgi:hypothetical protein
MRMMNSKLAALAVAALISLAGSGPMLSGANAESRFNDPNIQNATALSDSRANRTLRSRGGLRNDGGRNWNNRRYYGNNWNNSRYYGSNFYNDGYGRRYGRNSGFGIYLNLGDNNSGCGYSYRKWKYTGSRYWRSRYYDCVG